MLPCGTIDTVVVLVMAHTHLVAASGTPAWTVVATFAAVVAALAALVTVIFAGLTVRDGRDAHAEEMGARTHALVAEMRLQRLVHTSRLTDVLTAIARATYDDALTPPVPSANSQPPSMIPSLQAQLRTELAAFYALDSPELKSSDALAANAYGDLDDVPYETASPAAIRKSGRGLMLVEAISDRWAWHAAPGTGGKVVWALCGPAPSAGRRSEDGR